MLAYAGPWCENCYNKWGMQRAYPPLTSTHIKAGVAGGRNHIIELVGGEAEVGRVLCMG